MAGGSSRLRSVYNKTTLIILKKSIFHQQSSEISSIFDRVPASKILIVVLDFAKSKHVCLFCSGNGDQLRNPFTVHNNKEGFQYLCSKIQNTTKQYGILPKDVIIGGEDCPPFALPLLWQLDQTSKYLVVRVNAWKAKSNRQNLLASTDKLDLLGIGKSLINREAYRVFPESIGGFNCDFGDLDATRESSRCRDALVVSKTAVSNRIHSVVKVLFPVFLSGSKGGVSPFSKTSLDLMGRNDFSAASYARKSVKPLATRLEKLGVADPVEKAIELIRLAKESLAPPSQIIDARRKCLHALVKSYVQLLQSCNDLEVIEAKSLAKHSGAFLSTIPGWGIVTAAGVSGEQGHPASMQSASSMCSYAGIVPSIKQTGGPDSPAKPGSVKRRCNHRLKNHLVRTVNSMGTLNGPSEFQEAYQVCLDNKQHADFVMARRLLGSIKFMCDNQTIYLPPHLRGETGEEYREQLFEYLSVVWPKIVIKWRGLGAADLAFSDDNPLGIWRRTIEELYGIELPLVAPKKVRLKNQEG